MTQPVIRSVFRKAAPAALLAVFLAHAPAHAEASPLADEAPRPEARDQYRAILSSIATRNWTDARARIGTLGEKDAFRSYALAELYLAKGSPKVELFDLLDLLAKASWLPQADRIKALATARGAQTLPDMPQIQKLVWMGAAPRRSNLSTIKADLAAQALGTQILPLIKNDDPAGAEGLLGPSEMNLTPEGLTEWRQRIAWSYYIENDDANARRMATRALESGTGGEWRAQAFWTVGLAAWRQKDWKAAAAAFTNVSALATNADMRSAGAYWGARASMVAGDPAKVENLLRTAAGNRESFYGLLARETLGMPLGAEGLSAKMGVTDDKVLKTAPGAQAAIALASIGETQRADEMLRRQAQIGGAAQYATLLRIAAALDMPATQLWLAHNGPGGKQADSFARFPAPSWQPAGGWRVDPALVHAHTLQESAFQANAVSPAGAVGLMQVRPGTAGDVADSGTVGVAQLQLPSVNMEYGQRYLEKLRDMSATGGLLPKVMAAYNAGPTPVERWNYQVHDGGDPLLFIESLPYWETRAYVNTVMRNYWMYQMQAKGSAESLTGMSQGLWPRFPGMKGKASVRVAPPKYAPPIRTVSARAGEGAAAGAD